MGKFQSLFPIYLLLRFCGLFWFSACTGVGVGDKHHAELERERLYVLWVVSIIQKALPLNCSRKKWKSSWNSMWQQNKFKVYTYRQSNWTNYVFKILEKLISAIIISTKFDSSKLWYENDDVKKILLLF